MPAPKRVVRIAHAFGNSRPSLARALAADCDMIEVDMWYRGGDFRIHHEHKVRWFPLLIDRKMRTHKPGKYAVRIGNYYIRPDIGTLRLEELLKTVAGRKRLLLDVKGHYTEPDLTAYVESLVGLIRKHHGENWTAICGQTYTVLHRIREYAPDLEVRYSIERPYQWERFLNLVEAGNTRICIAYGFIDDEKAKFMEDRGVDLYCWTVDDWDAARHLVGEGVDGIISNDLALLAQLHDWVPGETPSAGSGAPPKP